MWCNYSADRFCRRKLEGKRGPLRLQGVVRERYNDFFWPETISMDAFVRGKWTSRPGYPYKGWLPQFARKTKARFTNLIENEIVPPCPPPSLSWEASKLNSVFLLSFQSSEPLKQYLDHSFTQRGKSFYFQLKNEATIKDVFIRFINEVKGRDRGMV